MSLPVITAAIDLVIETKGKIASGNRIELDLPNINDRVVFDIDNIIYENKKDYIKSGVKVLKESDLIGDISVKGVLNGNIPIRAGTSSSSALSVSWIGFLLASVWSSEKIIANRGKIAEYAYLSEVEEFGESGGRMDQYASALGKINYFTFHDVRKTVNLPARLKGFVLGDSGEPKDTQKTLKRIRTGQESGLNELRSLYPFKNNFSINYDIAKEFFPKVRSEVRSFLRAVLLNHKITEEAKRELSGEKYNSEKIASLMNLHHSVLRDDLSLSTKKIEKMIHDSLKAGALSAKINGSGEGGCMFAYCPGREEEVFEAIKRADGTPYILKIHDGLTVEVIDE